MSVTAVIALLMLAVVLVWVVLSVRYALADRPKPDDSDEHADHHTRMRG